MIKNWTCVQWAVTPPTTRLHIKSSLLDGRVQQLLNTTCGAAMNRTTAGSVGETAGPVTTLRNNWNHLISLMWPEIKRSSENRSATCVHFTSDTLSINQRLWHVWVIKRRQVVMECFLRHTQQYLHVLTGEVISPLNSGTCHTPSYHSMNINWR